MSTPPTGTVTFLFTDIEGSTALAQAHPSGWEAARRRHHAILRAAIDAQQGHIFQVIGDACCAAFHNAADALTAALAAQRALQAEDRQEVPVRARMGIHTGAAEFQEGEYRGYLTLAHVQRVMAAAHGGQVLVSHAASALLARQMPAGVALRDLGTQRLKGLLTPERLWQVVAPDLRDDFPPLRTRQAAPNNLPVQLTSFIGRDKEIAAVSRLLGAERVGGGGRHAAVIADALDARPDAHAGDPYAAGSADAPSAAPGLAIARLLTLTGSGGTGKTRLSLEVAAVALERFPDGVWFVELAPLADPALIPQTVMTALGIREQPGRPLVTTLCEYLADKHMLLLLDNCEHLIDGSARLVDTLLRAAPQLQVLASSREALGIAGEATYHVPSLQMPDPKGDLAPDSLAHFDSVRLFVERARAAKSDFALTAANAPALALICFRLDGIPLAIELAAARVRALRVEQIAERLDDRFRLLTGGSRTALPRQQTLRALIDWSYSLLSEPERILLRRLSVFAGGWTLEAAEAVTTDDPRRSPAEGLGQGMNVEPIPPSAPFVPPQTGFILQPSDILDLLTRLVDKSLVNLDDQSAEPRYRLLETIRQYARDRLLESDEGSAVRDRHLAFFARFAEEAAPKLNAAGQAYWFDRFESEHDNLRAAIEWSGDSRNALMHLQLAASALFFWYVRGYHTEGTETLHTVLTQTAALPLTTQLARARIQAIDAYLTIVYTTGTMQASRDSIAELVELAERFGELGERARAFQWRGMFEIEQGDYVESHRWLLRALEAAEGGPSHIRGGILWFLGDEAYRQSDFALAQLRYAESSALFKQTGDKNRQAYVLRRLGYLSLYQGDLALARESLAQSLANNLGVTERMGIIGCVAGLAAVKAAHRKLTVAAQLFGAVTELLRKLHATLLPTDRLDYERNLALVRAQLAPAEFDAAWAVGQAWTLEQAVEIAQQEEFTRDGHQ